MDADLEFRGDVMEFSPIVAQEGEKK